MIWGVSMMGTVTSLQIMNNYLVASVSGHLAVVTRIACGHGIDRGGIRWQFCRKRSSA